MKLASTCFVLKKIQCSGMPILEYEYENRTHFMAIRPACVSMINKKSERLHTFIRWVKKNMEGVCIIHLYIQYTANYGKIKLMHSLQRLTVRNLNGLFSFFFAIFCMEVYTLYRYIYIYCFCMTSYTGVFFFFVRGRSSDILVFHIMWHRICSKGLNFNPRSKYGMDSPTTWKKFQNLKYNKKHGKKSTYCKIYIICLLTENKKQMHNYNAIYQIYLTEKCWFIHHYLYNNNWSWNSIGLE